MYPEFGPSNVRPEVSLFAKRMEGRLVMGKVAMLSESFGTSPLLIFGTAMLARFTPEFLLLSLRQEVR